MPLRGEFNQQEDMLALVERIAVAFERIAVAQEERTKQGQLMARQINEMHEMVTEIINDE